MKSTFLLLCIISLCASCSSTDHSEEEKTELPIPPQSPVELNVTLNMTQATFKTRRQKAVSTPHTEEYWPRSGDVLQTK